MSWVDNCNCLALLKTDLKDSVESRGAESKVLPKNPFDRACLQSGVSNSSFSHDGGLTWVQYGQAAVNQGKGSATRSAVAADSHGGDLCGVCLVAFHQGSTSGHIDRQEDGTLKLLLATLHGIANRCAICRPRRTRRRACVLAKSHPLGPTLPS